MTEIIQIYSPSVLWHGGATESGKPDPVFSVDLHPNNVLATAGVDENLPPKGCVRLWKVNPQELIGQDDSKCKDNFLIEFSDHQHAVNVCRFSPCGLMLASASTRQIVVYTAKSVDAWRSLSQDDIREVERTFLRPSLDEIRDLAWSPDSTFLVAGSVDNKGEILRISSRDSVILNGHTSYVQGVAWDPLNQMVVTQSADRTVKVHQLKYRPGAMAKLAQRGHSVIKMHAGYDLADGVEPPELTAADFGVADETNPKSVKIEKKNLYADSTVPCFFRRPSFSPDGMLLITPTGVNRPMSNPNLGKEDFDPAPSGASSSGASGGSFCTHVYARDHLQSPVLSLVGLEDPSVAVRCSPVLYEFISLPDEQLPPTVFRGDYRMIFAVVTVTAVYIYDTQHPYPLARLGGLHLACINDATWSGDGDTLIVCSSDGYVTFVKFAPGSLGRPLATEKVPISVKNIHRCLYNYTPPPVETAPKRAPTKGVKENSPANVDVDDADAAGTLDVSEPKSLVKSCNSGSLGSPTVDHPTVDALPAAESNRKRITPTLVQTGSGNKNLNGNMSILAEVQVPRSPEDVLNAIASTSASISTGAGGPTANSKKRRITPMLVTSSILAAPPIGLNNTSSQVQPIENMQVDA